MNQSSFEEIAVSQDVIGQSSAYLHEGMQVTMQMDKAGAPLLVQLPEKVRCIVKETDAYMKGQTASASYKPAVLENGRKVLVPPFVSAGDAIMVSIEDETYSERA